MGMNHTEYKDAEFGAKGMIHPYFFVPHEPRMSYRKIFVEIETVPCLWGKLQCFQSPPPNRHWQDRS